jgi:DNA-binding NarL/FixJ family response regulator
MRLGMYLTSLTKPELEELRGNLNLTDDEMEVFNGLSKGRSRIRIADDCMCATSTVDNRIKAINNKLNRLLNKGA